MTKEEQILMEQFGRKTSFRVPEGYFDSLADRVMSNIPQVAPSHIDINDHADAADNAKTAKVVPLWHRVATRRAVAAVAIVAMMTGAAIGFVRLHHGGHQAQLAAQTNSVQHTAASSSESSMFDEAVEYTMYDNQDIYASLVSESRQ